MSWDPRALMTSILVYYEAAGSIQIICRTAFGYIGRLGSINLVCMDESDVQTDLQHIHLCQAKTSRLTSNLARFIFVSRTQKIKIKGPVILFYKKKYSIFFGSKFKRQNWNIIICRSAWQPFLSTYFCPGIFHLYFCFFSLFDLS